MYGPICANVKTGLRTPSAIKWQTAETGPNCRRFGLQFQSTAGIASVDNLWCGHRVSLHRDLKA